MTDRTNPKSFRPVDDSSILRITERDVEDARRLLSLLVAGTGARWGEAPMPGECSGPDVSPPALMRRARDTLANRRRRQDIFGKAMFGEPAWEMLLLLYITEPGPRQSISRLADESGASRTTALRWIDYLEGQGLIRREAHPNDRRIAFVQLTQKGRQSIELYLIETSSTAA